MRKIITLIIFHISLIAQAYNLANVNQALNLMASGDVASAVELLKNKSATNDMTAQFYLGQCYEFGIGIDKSDQNAFLMYRRAAERGFPPAMMELAKCYRDGVGVKANPDRAHEWFSRYIKRNDGSTIPDLVSIYSASKSEDKHPAKPAPLYATNPDNETLNKTHQSITATPAEPKHEQKNTSAPIPYKSDVDIDVPKSAAEKSSVFAFIIANEDYQDVASVPNALNDGEIMSMYCRRTLGLPDANVHLVKNATLNNIKREINIMNKIATAYKGEASFIVYYAGHGIPDESSRDAYLLPVDGYPTDITTCLRLRDFYSTLGSMPSQKTIIILDACFSGATREDNMLASARGVAIKAKPSAPTGNMVVISAASGDETAYPYKEEKHGLFTYFLLKKLKETKGTISLGSLFEYVTDNVNKKSIVVNGKTQTPTALPAQGIGDSWKNWTLN